MKRTHAHTPGRGWTQQELDEIDLLLQDHTQKEVADLFEITLPRLSQLCRQYGIRTSRERLPKLPDDPRWLWFKRVASRRMSSAQVRYLWERIELPDKCPVLGITLDYSKGGHTHNAPSLDRIIPSLDYSLGNVRVISLRANRLKGDATLEEVKALLAYMQKNVPRILKYLEPKGDEQGA